MDLQVFVAVQTSGDLFDEKIEVIGTGKEVAIAGQFCLDAEKTGIPADRFEVQRWTQKGWQESYVYVAGNGWTSVDTGAVAA